MSLRVRGGNDYNSLIEDGREQLKQSRDALKILRTQISEAIQLNKENANLIIFLANQSAQIESVSDANDEIGLILEKLWKIGAIEKVERSKKERDNNKETNND